MALHGIVLAGFGGQGILFAGKVIAYAGLSDGKEVSWMPSYGPEMRGGTANCSVCVSDEPIGSPLVLNPHSLIAMNIPSYDKFIDTVLPGGFAVIDSSLIPAKTGRDDITVSYVPATQLSKERDLASLANMILVGKLLKLTGFAGFDAVEAAVKKSVPASKTHLIEPNLRAIRLGMEY